MVNSTGDSIHGNKVSEICHFYMEEVRMTTGFPSKVYYVNFIFALVFNIFLTISTIFLNSVTILAYMKSALLKSKKAYFLIMLLSVNDLLVGLFGEVSFVILLVTALIGFWKCEVYIVLEFPAFCLTPLSIMTLFGLNIERYLSILHPLYHHTKVTKSKLLKMVVSFWLLAIALCSLYVVFGNIMNILFTFVLALIAISTFYIYASIYIASRRRTRVPGMQMTGIRGTEVPGSQGRTNQAYEMQNIKMAKSCGIVVGLTFLCNIPYAVANSLSTSDVISLWVLWSITTAFISSSLNSIVLFWNKPVLRKEAKNLFNL